MAVWLTGELPLDRLGEAWPLLRLRHPGLTFDGWISEARRLVFGDPAGGVQIVQTSAGYIFAVAAYRARAGRSQEHVLELPFVAYVHLNSTADPLDRLMDELERIARRNGCGEIRLDGKAILADGDLARWTRLGYRRDGTALCRPVAPPTINVAREHAETPHR